MSDLSTACGRLGNAAYPYILQATLADLEGHWLELHCCRGKTLMPCKLAKMRLGQAGPGRTLQSILDGLKCQVCGSPPCTAWLNETPHREPCNGPTPGWSVQLIPPPAPAAMMEAAE